MSENGNKNTKEKDLISEKFTKSKEPFKEISIKEINAKLYSNELEIKDILHNQDCINDLIRDTNSKYKIIITIKNIKTLIEYCLNPNFILNNDSETDIRFPYFACQILCSQCILLFSQSISYIKKSSQTINEQKDIKEQININENNNIDLK